MGWSSVLLENEVFWIFTHLRKKPVLRNWVHLFESRCTLNTTVKADSHIACRAHAVPLPRRAVNSHMPCRAPAMLRQCRVLRESPHGSRKYPNCESYSLTDRLFFLACCYHSLQSSVWIVVRRIGMLLITIFVELRVVNGRSRKRAGSPHAVSRRPCCAVAFRRTAWSENGMGME
jgi:hypothetical protein